MQYYNKVLNEVFTCLLCSLHEVLGYCTQKKNTTVEVKSTMILPSLLLNIKDFFFALSSLYALLLVKEEEERNQSSIS